ncbi:MAG: hypothetical protein ND895_11015 [Pyrinomonadaceae bacterium]|nr:hypothetical protein [Pyrinomonadaceae bacterium]
MKRIPTSLLVTMSILLSLVSLPATAQGAPPQRFRSETGLIIPGPHQRLRLVVDGTSNTILTVRFRRVEYMQDSCNSDGVCKLSVSSQTTSPPITLMPGEAASIDFPSSPFGVRGLVLGNFIGTDVRNVRVTAMLIGPTGNVDAFVNTTFDDQA